MQYDAQADKELIRAFQRGDNMAFDAFTHRHIDRVYRMTAAWLTDASRAEDATQETFVRALRQLPRFRFGAEPFTWLYRTAFNVCREYNRQRQHEALLIEPAGDHPDVGASLDALRAAKQVHMLVKALPPRQQQVVVLRVFEECSVRDTARTMRCREGTVKALLHKAMTALREQSSPRDDTND